MSRFWREARERASASSLNDIITDLSFFASKARQRGRKPLYDRSALRKTASGMRYKDRRTVRSFSKSTGIPKSTLERMIKQEKVFRCHSSPVKPVLTEDNKLVRVLYCLEEVYPVATDGGGYLYKDGYDRVDVDEKWFTMTRERETYIVVDSDYSSCSSSSDSETEIETDGDDRKKKDEPI